MRMRIGKKKSHPRLSQQIEQLVCVQCLGSTNKQNEREERKKKNSGMKTKLNAQESNTYKVIVNSVKLYEKCLPLRRVFILTVISLRLMLIISIVAIHIIPTAGIFGRTAFVVAIVIGTIADATGIS